MSNCIRESSNAGKPHSKAVYFSSKWNFGPSVLPTRISTTPIPVATKRNNRVGRYSASTVFSRLRAAEAGPLLAGCRAGRDRPARRFVWCPRGDSNPHDRSRYHLKVVRLPIPPPGQVLHLPPDRVRSRDIVIAISRPAGPPVPLPPVRGPARRAADPPARREPPAAWPPEPPRAPREPHPGPPARPEPRGFRTSGPGRHRPDPPDAPS